MIKLLVLPVLLMFSAGCTLISEKVNLKPNLLLDQDNVGKGAQVYLTVEDDRMTPDIGYRNSILHSGLITLNNDIKTVFYDQMKKVLESQGFVVMDNKNLSRKCVIKIKDFKYELVPSVAVDIKRHIVMSIHAINKDANKDYFNNYFTEDVSHEFIAPTQDHNEDLINQTVEKLFRNVFADYHLYQSLT